MTKETLNNDVEGTSQKRLKMFIEKVERLELEKAAIAEDVKDVYGEAKSTGFDTVVMKKIVALRKLTEATRREQEELLELYKSAVGMD